MFHIAFPVLLSLYLTMLVSVIALGWCWDAWQQRRLARLARRFRLQCRRCALEWEDRSAEPLPKCPRCGSVNERTPLESV
ncbi:MAG: hypothetical protein JO295_05035 [Verrucomicrobia bacterium]|nr:hypothetical protein [Verrucomicrobiota bacterium]